MISFLSRANVRTLALAGAIALGTGMSAAASAASPVSPAASPVQTISNLPLHAFQPADYRHRPGKRHMDQRHMHRKLGPRQIRRSLRHRGFHGIEILRERRHVYVVRAHGWRGHPVRLVVDARSAEILRRKPLRHDYNWGYGWSRGW